VYPENYHSYSFDGLPQNADVFQFENCLPASLPWFFGPGVSQAAIASNRKQARSTDLQIHFLFQAHLHALTLARTQFFGPRQLKGGQGDREDSNS
jgi:hypothetical protein